MEPNSTSRPESQNGALNAAALVAFVAFVIAAIVDVTLHGGLH